MSFVSAVDCKNTVDLFTFYDYIYPMLTMSLKSGVRITGLVILNYVKSKKKMIEARVKRGQDEKSRLEECNFPPAQFKAFPFIYIPSHAETTQMNREDFLPNQEMKSLLKSENLSEVFSVTGVTLQYRLEWNGTEWVPKPMPKVLIKLSDEVLGAALH